MVNQQSSEQSGQKEVMDFEASPEFRVSSETQ
jgi:hypothetical protein